MADTTRYYVDHDGTFIRVVGNGSWSTFNPNTKRWFHVTTKPGRDYLSRAVENGDAAPIKPSLAPR